MWNNDRDSVDKFIRLSDVIEMIGLSQSTIWRMEKLGKFPKRRRLSASACGWLKSEVLA